MEQPIQKRTLKVTDGTYGVGNFLVVFRWYFGEKKSFNKILENMKSIDGKKIKKIDF
jgi:hypothetical protein